MVPRLNRRGTTAAESEPDVLGVEKTNGLVKDERGRAQLTTGPFEAKYMEDRAEDRRLSRLIASRTTEEERETLYRQHGELAFKQLMNELSADEECRLQLVKWSLARIQDAELGPRLDALEAAAEYVEMKGKRVTDFLLQSRKPPPADPFFPQQPRRRGARGG